MFGDTRHSKKYEYLLVGSPFTIIIRTDHSTLKQVQLGGELKNKRLARWQEFFGGFDYKIEWIPGVTNLIGDGISRSLMTRTPLDLFLNWNPCTSTY